MARTTPTVRDGILGWRADGVQQPVAVDSAAWQSWLAQARSFAFASLSGSFTAHCAPSQRGGRYWRAYLRRHGVLYRAYLGRSEDLTLARLEAVAHQLAAQVAQRSLETASTAQTAPYAPPSDKGNPPRVAYSLPPDPLLVSRLSIPLRPQAVLQRPQLLEQLSAGVGRALTLVVAPAGFGKTTQLSVWALQAVQQGRPVAWASLERGDNDPVRFWSAVIGALQTAYPGFAQETLLALPALAQRPLEATVATLLRDLATVPHELVLVLDDYQVISEPAVHASLERLLDWLPPNLHLLLASRTIPPLHVARLRARGALAELRAVDLRLSPDEASAFLRRVMSCALPEAELVRVAAASEGWVAGLQLVALALREGANQQRLGALLTGNHQYLAAYFGEEVLQHVPAELQRFLLETAVLDRLCAPLCLAVTGTEQSAQLLERLEREQLFLLPLDEQQLWYRYHPLFAGFLRDQLARRFPERVAALAEAAARWFAANGMTTAAVEHAMAGACFGLAGELIAAHAEHWLNTGELHTVLTWIDALPEPSVANNPRLSLVHLCALLFAQRWDCVEARLRAAQLPGSAVVGETLLLHALATLLRGNSVAAETLLAQAEAQVPAHDAFVRRLLSMAQGATAWVSGDRTTAQELLAQLHYPALSGSAHQIALLALAHQAHFHAVAGELGLASLRFQQVLRGARSRTLGDDAPVNMATLGLAQLCYERNALADARSYARQAFDNGRRWDSPELFLAAALVLIRVALAQGAAQSARLLLREAEQPTRGRMLSPWARCTLALCHIQLALAEEELLVAAEWSALLAEELEQQPMSTVREQAITARAQVLLAQHQCEQALCLLVPARAAANQAGRVRNLVPILVWQAYAHEAQGERNAALAALRQAVELATPGCFVRSVLDAGAPIGALLQALAKQTDAPAYTYTLHEHWQAACARNVAPPLMLRERLSEREQQVLQLVADGASNQEVAQVLVVTLSTVKKHLSAIFQKLGVHSRTQAVALARHHRLL